MALKRYKRNKPREQWNKREIWPHEYAQQIIAGKKTMADVPAHFQAWVATHLEIAKHADERLAVKHGAQIAMLKTLWERRRALAKVPVQIRDRTEYHAKQIFEQLRKERQPS